MLVLSTAVLQDDLERRTIRCKAEQKYQDHVCPQLSAYRLTFESADAWTKP